jgi:hypothetical protein
MMRKFLRVLQPADLTLQDASWEQLLGERLVEALRRASLLEDGPRATSLECGGDHCGEARRVVHCPGVAPGKDYVALCATDGGCMDVPLSEDDLRTSTLSWAGVAQLLRRLLRIEGRGKPTHVAGPVFGLGEIEKDGLRADAFLALNPDEGFHHFLVARIAAPRPTVVFVTSARALDPALAEAHGPSSRVEVVLVEDVLCVESGVIAARDWRATRAPKANAPAALLLSHDGERTLTAEEYLALVEHAAERFDLFLDAATPRRAGRKTYFLGGRREGARWQEEHLTEGEAAAIAEFIVRARNAPIDIEKELTSVKDKVAKQLYKKGAAKIGATHRFILRERGGRAFRPPPGARWALIRTVLP